MRFASSLLVAILAVFVIQDAGHAQNFDKVEIKTVSAGNGVYMLTGAGGNIGVLTGPEGVALIDSQFGQLHQRIKDAIAEVGGGPVITTTRLATNSSENRERSSSLRATAV